MPAATKAPQKIEAPKETSSSKIDTLVTPDVFIDLCKDLGKATKVPKVKDVVRRCKARKVTQFSQEVVFLGTDARFTLHAEKGARGKPAPLASGTNGSVYRGEFGDGPNSMSKCIIKVQKANDDMVPELLIQTKLFCHLRATSFRRRTPEGNPVDSATVPKPLFAASVPGLGGAIGMSPADMSLAGFLSDQVKDPSVSLGQLTSTFRRIMRQTCNLLDFLQAEFQFQHGDLHSENVMISKGSLRVYVIDFGMSSATFAELGSRLDTDPYRYGGAPLTKSLDLLTLLVSLIESLDFTIANSKAQSLVRLMNTAVGPLFNRILATVSPKGTPERRLRDAMKVARTNGANHMFYENTIGLDYPLAEPANLLRHFESMRYGSDGVWLPSSPETGLFFSDDKLKMGVFSPATLSKAAMNASGITIRKSFINGQFVV